MDDRCGYTERKGNAGSIALETIAFFEGMGNEEAVPEDIQLECKFYEDNNDGGGLVGEVYITRACCIHRWSEEGVGCFGEEHRTVTLFTLWIIARDAKGFESIVVHAFLKEGFQLRCGIAEGASRAVALIFAGVGEGGGSNHVCR